MSGKVVLDRAQIEALYKTRNLEETAMQLGVSVLTLRRRMAEFGMPSHSNGWRPDTAIDRQTLVDLYEKHSVVEIAEVLRVDPKTVTTRMREYGLKLRTKGPVKTFEPDRAELEDLYFNKHYSMREIADYYGVGETVVFKRLRDYKLILSKRVAKEQREQVEKARADRDSLGMQLWRKSVLQNAGYKCQRCGLEHRSICKCCGQKSVIHAHHIKPFSLFPELRLDVSNGVALCVMCHWTEHREENRVKR